LTYFDLDYLLLYTLSSSTWSLTFNGEAQLPWHKSLGVMAAVI